MKNQKSAKTPEVNKLALTKGQSKLPLSESGELVKFDEAGMPQLEVWLEDETIWLTQRQMAELFGCAPQNITYHLREIFKIGELDEPATCKEFLQVQIEGTRRISRTQKLYNLDAIISVSARLQACPAPPLARTHLVAGRPELFLEPLGPHETPVLP